MSLGKTWFTLENAESKYGVDHERLLAWVNEGLVRFESEHEEILRVNGDDIELQISHIE